MRKTTIAYGKGNKRIVFSAVLASASFVCRMLELNWIVSLCFAVSIAWVVLNFLWDVARTKKASAYIIILFVLMLFSVVASGLRSDFEFYKRAIIVFCCVLCLNNASGARMNKNEFRLVQILFLLSVGVANYLFYFKGFSNVYYGSTQLVAMNFGNPNECALWLAMLFIALDLCAFVEPKGWLKLLCIFAAVSLLPVINSTGSRNSLLACLLMAGATVLFEVLPFGKIPKWTVSIIAILPLIVFFAYMYIFVPNLDTFSEWFSFLVEDGKTLTSRVTIWGIVMDDFAECFWLGKYNIYFDEQMHNSLMTLFCMFGASFVALVCVLFYKVVNHLNLFAQLALIAVWFTGCFEASVFVGVAGLYLMMEIIPSIGNLHRRGSVCQSHPGG